MGLAASLVDVLGAGLAATLAVALGWDLGLGLGATLAAALGAGLAVALVALAGDAAFLELAGGAVLGGVLLTGGVSSRHGSTRCDAGQTRVERAAL
jgi:hypothetical protein